MVVRKMVFEVKRRVRKGVKDVESKKSPLISGEKMKEDGMK